MSTHQHGLLPDSSLSALSEQFCHIHDLGTGRSKQAIALKNILNFFDKGRQGHQSCPDILRILTVQASRNHKPDT